MNKEEYLNFLNEKPVKKVLFGDSRLYNALLCGLERECKLKDVSNWNEEEILDYLYANSVNITKFRGLAKVGMRKFEEYLRNKRD